MSLCGDSLGQLYGYTPTLPTRLFHAPLLFPALRQPGANIHPRRHRGVVPFSRSYPLSHQVLGGEYTVRKNKLHLPWGENVFFGGPKNTMPNLERVKKTRKSREFL
jgi:hypothetical protein